MEWNRFIERTLWALWWLLVGGAGLWVVAGSIGYFSKLDWLPNESAGWAQALGSVAALFVAIFIARGDRSFTKSTIRAREKVVIRAVEECCVEALGAIGTLNHGMRNYYLPVNTDSPFELRNSLARLEDRLRDLRAVDLMSMPATDVIDCVITARAIALLCVEEAQKGWDPRSATQVREYSPLEGYLEQMQAQIIKLRRCATSVG